MPRCNQDLTMLNYIVKLITNQAKVYVTIFQGSLSACEFLLLNGAKLDKKDRQGRSPLHIATMLGNTGSVNFITCIV